MIDEMNDEEILAFGIISFFIVCSLIVIDTGIWYGIDAMKYAFDIITYISFCLVMIVCGCLFVIINMKEHIERAFTLVFEKFKCKIGIHLYGKNTELNAWHVVVKETIACVRCKHIKETNIMESDNGREKVLSWKKKMKNVME